MRQRWYGVDRVGIEPNDEAWETASVLVGGCGAALGHCQMLPRRDKDNRAEASPKLGLARYATSQHTALRRALRQLRDRNRGRSPGDLMSRAGRNEFGRIQSAQILS